MRQRHSPHHAREKSSSSSSSSSNWGRCRRYVRRRVLAILFMVITMVAIELIVLTTIFGPQQTLQFFIGGDSGIEEQQKEQERIRRRYELSRQQEQQQREGGNGIDISAQVKRLSKARPYQPFPKLYDTHHDENYNNHYNQNQSAHVFSANIIDSTQFMSPEEQHRIQTIYSKDMTIKILQSRHERNTSSSLSSSTTSSEKELDYDLVPPWFTIVDNFYKWKFHNNESNHNNNPNPPTMKDTTTTVTTPRTTTTRSITSYERPIILGSERCTTYQNAVLPKDRAMGPAGLFSSGTNLLADLVRKNCQPPTQRKFLVRFAAWQVPWGKHNPEGTRLHHAVENRENVNQTSTLPVVLIRHPYSWLQAMCKHSYSVRWLRRKEICDETVMLKNKAEVRYGSYTNRTGHVIQTMEYESVLHLYKDWYQSYLEVTSYPLLMTRLEDLVFHPQHVVTAICDCLGGTVQQSTNFTHLHQSANLGDGHGKFRTDDEVTAFINHGKSLNNGYEFSTSDRVIMKNVFEEYPTLFDAFGYKLPLPVGGGG